MNGRPAERWQLPDGVDELLPEAAWRVERLRRDIVDRCRGWGFELVMPPLIEYIDSLLSGSGETMNLQTFKLVDQHNGRTLGVRADMTPQVARVDAHALRSELPNRLCYTGTVLRTRADGAGGSRSPQQFGAELFGHAGVESDIEILRLMLETVSAAGLPAARQLLDLGHVGVYRTLAADAALAVEDEATVFEALQRGSVPDVAERLAAARPRAAGAPGTIERLAALGTLRGGPEVTARARELLHGASAAVGDALGTLDRVVAALGASHPDIALHVDLGELRGYSYHTGMLFAIHDDAGAELVRGGRYDRIGEAFGHARPATGFSGDLKQLAEIAAAFAPDDGGTGDGAVHVAEPDAPGAREQIRALREGGARVLVALPGTPSERARCERELIRDGERWHVRPLLPDDAARRP